MFKSGIYIFKSLRERYAITSSGSVEITCLTCEPLELVGSGKSPSYLIGHNTQSTLIVQETAEDRGFAYFESSTRSERCKAV